MLRGGEIRERRANVFEIVGAWLHVWVPPRDVEIPPVPWRKLAYWTAGGLVALGIALAIMVPRIDSGKQRRAAADAAETARFQAATRRRIAAAQTPRHGRDAALLPPAGASPAQRQAARDQLVRHVTGVVLADAKARSARGQIPFAVEGPANCAPHGGTTLSGRFGVLDCFVVASRIKKTAHNVAGAAGFPFRAVVDFRSFSYTWCKEEGVPGEMGVPNPKLLVALPRACQDPNSQ